MIGPKFVDVDENIVYNSLAYDFIKNEDKLESLAEELRVLYVAMTRAREKLILVGQTAGNSQLQKKIAEKWSQAERTASGARLTSASACSAGSWLDWIGMVLWSKDKGGVPPGDWEINLIRADEIKLAQPKTVGSEIINQLKQSRPTAEERLQVNTLLEFEYPHVQIELAPKISVTELKRRTVAPEDSPEAELSSCQVAGRGAPMCAPGVPGLNANGETQMVSGQLLGTAYHEVFQRLDFHAADYRWEIERVIGVVLGQNVITAAIAEKIEFGKIADFLGSPLADRVRAAATVRREQPFVLAISANEIAVPYPRDEQILVQGIVDLLLVEPDGKVIIIDYKTDKVADAAVLVERYATQLRYYALAVERITGLKVSERIIWHVPMAREIKL